MADGYLDKAAKLLELLYGPPGARKGQTHLAMKQGGVPQSLPDGLGKMVRGYELPEEAEPVPEPAPVELLPTADYAKWADRLQKESQPIQEVPGLTPEKRRGLGGLIGGTAGTPTAEITGTLPEEPGAEGMSPDKRALLLRVLSGLTTAGRRMTSTPTLAEIRHGAKITPEFRPETQLAGAAEQIEQEERIKKAEAEAKTKAEEEGAKSPLVEAARKLATSMGLDPMKIKTEEQAKSMLMAFGQEEKIKLLQAQRGKLETEAKAGERAVALSQADMAAVSAGDLSRLPKEDKKNIQADRDKWLSLPEIKDYKTAYKAAQTVGALIDAGNSTASRAAVVQMVKASGDTGRLSDQDIARFEHRMGLKGWKDRLVNTLMSDLNPEQKEEYKTIVREMSQLAKQEIEEGARNRVQSMRSLYPHLPEDGLVKYYLGYAPGEKKEKTVDLISTTDPTDIARGVPMSTAQDFINSGQYRVVGD